MKNEKPARRPLLATCDPYLSALRTVGRAVEEGDPGLGRDFETARFHVFQAISRGNTLGAMTWLATLDISTHKLEGEMATTYKATTAKLAAILGSV